MKMAGMLQEGGGRKGRERWDGGREMDREELVRERNRKQREEAEGRGKAWGNKLREGRGTEGEGIEGSGGLA